MFVRQRQTKFFLVFLVILLIFNIARLWGSFEVFVSNEADIIKSSDAEINSFKWSRDKESKEKSRNDWSKVDPINCSKITYLNQNDNSNNSPALPRVGIVSFPGSGNTWVRYLIQVATGVWTGSVYHDQQLYEGGFKAELDSCKDRRNIAIKAHHPGLDTQHGCPFDKIILVIRDPFHAILAEFNWRETNSHVNQPPITAYKTAKWRNFLVSRAYKWQKSTIGWLNQFASPSVNGDMEQSFTSDPLKSGKLLLVSFESLKQNTKYEVKRMVQFIGFHVFREKCLENTVGLFKREKKAAPDIRCLYKNTLTTKITEAISQVEDVARELYIQNLETEFDRTIVYNNRLQC